MAVDKDTVRHVAHLARIAVEENALQSLAEDLSKIIGWVEQLNEVDTSDVPPLTSIVASGLPMREDAVTDGDALEDILRNAPEREDGLFVVPKVVE